MCVCLRRRLHRWTDHDSGRSCSTGPAGSTRVLGSGVTHALCCLGGRGSHTHTGTNKEIKHLTPTPIPSSIPAIMCLLSGVYLVVCRHKHLTAPVVPRRHAVLRVSGTVHRVARVSLACRSGWKSLAFNVVSGQPIPPCKRPVFFVTRKCTQRCPTSPVWLDSFR